MEEPEKFLCEEFDKRFTSKEKSIGPPELSINDQFCMQDKAKGIQAKYAERIDWPIQTTSCNFFPKDITQIQDQCTRKYEVTKLSNVNIYIVSISYKTTLAGVVSK